MLLQHSAKQAYDPASEKEDKLPLLLSFLLPIVIMLGVFAGKEIFPFGDESFLRTDMYHQYAPFLAEFARTLKAGGSLTYSTEIGLGTNFVALFAYYLSTPFNWFLLLVPAGWVIEFMTYLIVLKIGFCGLTAGIYLKEHFRRNDLGIPVIATCYALSGYLAAYSWNNMWLDCLWLAPLILLGLEKLVRKNQPFLYCITLAFGILSNYYIAIMLCIFMVLYFVCEMILLPRKTPKEYAVKMMLFGVFSLLAGGLSAILLLPAYRCLLTTASASSTFPTSFSSYFSVLEMLARHMVNVEVEIGLEHWPNIYSGVICLLLFPLYIINPKVEAKEKIVKTSLLVLMLLSFSLNIPNYIWHGMHYPNSLPCRQSFLYTFVLLTMCYDGLRRARELSKGQVATCFWIAIAFTLVCEKVVTASEFHYYSFILTGLFVSLYALLLYLANIGSMRMVTACILALGITVVETGMNTAITSVTTVNRTDYWKNTDNYQILIEQAEERDNTGFFRVEKTPSRRTKNDAAWIGYQSASIFSSTTQASITEFYKTFGMEGNTNAYSFTGATPLVSSLLSVRFLIASGEQPEDPLYTMANRQEDTWLYENLYTMPLGFMIPQEIEGEFRYKDLENPPEVQNTYVERTAGTGPVLVEIAENTSFEDFEFTVEEEGRIFIWVDNSSISSVDVYIDDAHKSFNNVDRGYLLDLGVCKPGADISVSSGDEKAYTMYATAYRFDNAAFIDWYQKMNRQAFEVQEFTNSLWNTELIGDVKAEEDGMLFLSIPYDKGWTVLVDGAEVTTAAFEGTFMMFQVPAGTHTVDMSYRVPGFREGILLSLISLALLLLLMGKALRMSRKKRSQLPRFRGGTRGRYAETAGISLKREEAAREPAAPAKERVPEPEPEDGLTDDDLADMLMEDLNAAGGAAAGTDDTEKED